MTLAETQKLFADKQRESIDAFNVDKDAIAKLAKENLYGERTIVGVMRDGVSEYQLMREDAIAVTIGGVTYYVKAFTLDNQRDFFTKYVGALSAIGGGAAVYDYLSDTGKLYSAVIANETFYAAIVATLGVALVREQEAYHSQFVDVDNRFDPQIDALREGLRTATVREVKRIEKRVAKIVARKELEKNIYRKNLLDNFTKNITIEELMQLCLLVYLYNFDAVKKNLSIVMARLPKDARSIGETYVYSWLANSAAITRKYGERPSIDYKRFFNASPKEGFDGRR